MIKKLMLMIAIALLMFSCATATRVNQSKEIDVSITLTGDSLEFGPIVTGTVEISLTSDSDVPMLIASAKSEARFRAIQNAKGYDFLLFPKYSITQKNGLTAVTVTGRATRPKVTQ